MSPLSDAVGPFDARPTRRPEAYYPPPGASDLDVHDYRVTANHLLLVDALNDTLVDLLSFDSATALRLATLDPAVVRVIVGWIVRAHLEGLTYYGGAGGPRGNLLRDIWSAR